MSVEIKRKNFTVKVTEPEVYVDNKSRKRSGHMSHALAGKKGIATIQTILFLKTKTERTGFSFSIPKCMESNSV